MAEEAGPTGLYAFYRCMATVTHPGLGRRARLADLTKAEDLRVGFRFAFGLAMLAIAALAREMLELIPPDLMIATMVEHRGRPPR
jgi:hypothetical protein